jgi:hypothetical protein
VSPPTQTIGYVTEPTPDWSHFGASAAGLGGDDLEDVPALRWPNSVRVFHRMRTDAQIDGLIRSVVAPLLRLDWRINQNGARDEVAQDISTQLNLPIKGDSTEFVQRGRKRFNHNEHLRMALLSPTVYGHMFFEMIGQVLDDTLAWKLNKLDPRMPQSLSRIDVASDGGLIDIVQFDRTNYRGRPIPVSQLVGYPWEKEGGNWTGRSMMRPLYKYWLLKDRMLRVDAMKNERFGLGIPYGTAAPGGDPANMGKMAQAARATETGGVGLPNGASVGIAGISGTLPDTLASIQLYNEEMARSFLAMFVNLGTTQTGSRALGESFVNFFVDALAAFANWYMNITNEHVIEDIVDWNWGVDEQAPLLEWSEREEEPLSIADLSNLIKSGALVVDAELQTWIRQRYSMPDYKGDAPLPTKPATPVQISPSGESAEPQPDEGEEPVGPPPVQSGGAPSKGTPKDKRLKENKKAKITSQEGSNIKSSSQTANNDNVGHRQPTSIEVQAATDFAALQQTWTEQTTDIVDEWSSVRSKQIDALVKDVEAAVKAEDSTALATLTAPTLGADIIKKHMVAMATLAVAEAKKEAKAQGVTLDASVDDLDFAGRADAVAALMARGLGDSASKNAILRYGTTSAAKDVAAGVRSKLEGLSDSFLKDTLGGAMTQAQNSGRRLVMSKGDDATKLYASELLDENTCEFCEGEDQTAFSSMADADEAYPAGGFVDCLGGPRCRGTVVAVYGEGA